MKIMFLSILVDDQAKALAFYTDVLGFRPKSDVPLGEHRWLTVVSPDAPDGVELVLEPDEHPAARPFKAALVEDGIPVTSSESRTSRSSTSGCRLSAFASRRNPRRWVPSSPPYWTTRAATSSRSPPRHTASKRSGEAGGRLTCDWRKGDLR